MPFDPTTWRWIGQKLSLFAGFFVKYHLCMSHQTWVSGWTIHRHVGFKDDRCLGLSLEIEKTMLHEIILPLPPKKDPGSPDVSLMSQKNVTQKMVFRIFLGWFQ